MKKIYYYDYKICNLQKNSSLKFRLGIAEENSHICRILFDTPLRVVHDRKDSQAVIRPPTCTKKKPDGFENEETSLIKEAAKQLDEYFNRKRLSFDLPLILHGTDFQMKVWEALQKIPYGKTCSYSELAAIIGKPKACRAAGMANNRNPIPIIIPCHRVIGHNGSLTGYAGGLELKRELLELESW